MLLYVRCAVTCLDLAQGSLPTTEYYHITRKFRITVLEVISTPNPSTSTTNLDTPSVIDTSDSLKDNLLLASLTADMVLVRPEPPGSGLGAPTLLG